MNNNSIRFATVFAALAFISIIIALVFYFEPEAQSINWLNYNEAVSIAKSQKKPIFVNFYSKYNKLSKQINDQLFANEKIKSILNSNYVLASIDIDNQINIDFAKKTFFLDKMPTFIVVSENGRQLKRFNNFLDLNIFYNWLINISYKYIDSWETYNKAKTTANNSNKSLLVFISNNNNRIDLISDLATNDNIYQIIHSNYIPTILLNTDYNDRFNIDLLNNKINNSNALDKVALFAPNDSLIFYYELNYTEFDADSLLDYINKSRINIIHTNK